MSLLDLTRSSPPPPEEQEQTRASDDNDSTNGTADQPPLFRELSSNSGSVLPKAPATFKPQKRSGNLSRRKRTTADDADGSDLDVGMSSSSKRLRLTPEEEENRDNLVDELGLDETARDFVEGFSEAPINMKLTTMMCYMVKHTSLLLALCIDDQLSVIKSPGFTEAVRHCFTAALLGEGIHWYGSKLTKRFLIWLQENPKHFGLARNFFDNPAVMKAAKASARLQIRQVRYKTREKVQTHIINNIFIGELTSAIVEVRDNPFMAPRHRQMAFIRFGVANWINANRPGRFWKYLDGQLADWRSGLLAEESDADLASKHKKMLDNILKKDISDNQNGWSGKGKSRSVVQSPKRRGENQLETRKVKGFQKAVERYMIADAEDQSDSEAEDDELEQDS